MFKIALCIKQVPDTTDIRWTPNNTMQREGVESVINPYDVYATEFALRVKAVIKDAQITVFTMGPNQAEGMLRKVIALGCDGGVLVSDRKFAGSDTYATGLTLSSAIKKALPDFDLIVCGQFAVDGDTAQTGPCIASFLDIPQVTYVKFFEKVDKKSALLVRELEDGIERVKVKFPVLVCVLQDDFEPHRALIDGIKFAQNVPITVLDMNSIGLSAEQTGLRGSPTYVSKAYRNMTNHNAQKYQLSAQDSAKLLDEKLKEKMPQ